ncbi:hypothetical protein ACWA1C_06505 [Flectobacillus roseus]
MKYVIFKKDDLLIPIFSNEMIVHSEIEAGKGRVPVSAGFCYCKNGYITVEEDSRSESLNLDSNPRDETILNWALCGYPVSVFLDYENHYPIPNEGNINEAVLIKSQDHWGI